ncbi:Inner membrane protein YnbA [Photorhabdus australis subsp. thailandensis]|uniref:Inner membrane protein YnbA n=2 Tax=Photorhabdus australis TaxID=286156 RepID=A0A1C0U8Z4_9GAMM|nr:Inner membrane protein YnbA [Photorhabdus australis subsp. thailandensis]
MCGVERALLVLLVNQVLLTLTLYESFRNQRQIIPLSFLPLIWRFVVVILNNPVYLISFNLSRFNCSWFSGREILMSGNEIKDRRPIKTRNAIWAGKAAKWLQYRGVTPNGISVASVVFAALAGLCFATCFWSRSFWLTSVLLIIGALFIQARLVCNLLDGMVAIEGGLRTSVGTVFNDLPDRIADSFILIGLGYGLTLFPFAISLGCIAALLAVLTAYIRLLGGTCGLPQRFLGPMAKQHRMALITVGSIVAAFLPQLWGQYFLLVLLIVITLGCLWTCIRRTRVILNELQEKDTCNE